MNSRVTRPARIGGADALPVRTDGDWDEHALTDHGTLRRVELQANRHFTVAESRLDRHAHRLAGVRRG